MTREKIKTAVRLFRSSLVPRHIRRANARKWLAADHQLGDRHILRSNRPVSWGTQVRSAR